jgi:hypothetical protein
MKRTRLYAASAGGADRWRRSRGLGYRRRLRGLLTDLAVQLTEMGYDHIYVHQVGPEQEGFLQFYKRGILPQVR